MNSTQLECFMQVAENLNFARAAEALHITQPSVTHQIHTLEAELNVKLFHRTTRSVSLTQAGLSFFGDAKNILSLMKISKMRLHDDSADNLTFFAMGFHSKMELVFLPDILKEMKSQIPLLHPIIKMVPFHALANLLTDETIDVMFEFKNEKTDKLRLSYVELTKAPIACVLPKGHPLAEKSSVSQAELKELSIVLCQPPVQVFSDISVFQQKEASNFSPANSYFSENIDEACTLVKAGLGFSLLPDLPPSRDPELAYIPYSPAGAVSYGLYYKGKKKDPVLKLFIELTKACFSKTNEKNT